MMLFRGIWRDSGLCLLLWVDSFSRSRENTVFMVMSSIINSMFSALSRPSLYKGRRLLYGERACIRDLFGLCQLICSLEPSGSFELLLSVVVYLRNSAWRTYSLLDIVHMGLSRNLSIPIITSDKLRFLDNTPNTCDPRKRKRYAIDNLKSAISNKHNMRTPMGKKKERKETIVAQSLGGLGVPRNCRRLLDSSPTTDSRIQVQESLNNWASKICLL